MDQSRARRGEFIDAEYEKSQYFEALCEGLKHQWRVERLSNKRDLVQTDYRRGGTHYWENPYLNPRYKFFIRSLNLRYVIVRANTPSLVQDT